MSLVICTNTICLPLHKAYLQTILVRLQMETVQQHKRPGPSYINGKLSRNTTKAFCGFVGRGNGSSIITTIMAIIKPPSSILAHRNTTGWIPGRRRSRCKGIRCTSDGNFPEELCKKKVCFLVKMINGYQERSGTAWGPMARSPAAVSNHVKTSDRASV